MFTDGKHFVSCQPEGIDLRYRDRSVGCVASTQISIQARRSRVFRRLRDRCSHHTIACRRAASFEAGSPGAVRGFALVDGLVGIGPHIDIVQDEVRAWRTIRAQELDRSSLHPIYHRPIPVLSCKNSQFLTISRTKTTPTRKVTLFICTPLPEFADCPDP